MIRLLIADDSALMRRLFTEVFEAEGDFEIVVARDGLETLAQLAAFQPHVVILDINMPHLDGLACLERIMLEQPTPVVMVSSVTQAGAEETIRAFELGAVEVVAKPSGALSLKMDRFGPQLAAAVRAAAQVRLSRTYRLADRLRSRLEPAAEAPSPGGIRRPRPEWRPAGLVVIGCSTGGPAALDAVLSKLPEDFGWPVLIAQHMPAAFTGALARRLDTLTPLTVREVTQETPLRAGEVYISRGDADMIVARLGEGLAAAVVAPAAGSVWRPSVDRLTDSALAVLTPSRIVGVLMTGMGNDGAGAMTRLRAAGGRTIAEAESSAVIWGMPGELVRAGGAEFIEPVDLIARRLVELAQAA